MRKLALLAIASLPLLGGCVSQVCDLPTASFSWALQDTNGSGWNCTQAGVAFVDVYIGSAAAVRFHCTDYGGTIDVSGLTPGRHPTTVEGVDSTGVIIDRAQFDVVVGDCGGTVYAPVLGEAVLQIDYHFGTPGTGADLCYATAGTSFMWFDLWDDVAGQALSSITTATSTTYPSWRDHYACGALGPPISFSVPFGSYTLKGIQEVVSPISAPAAVAESCTPTTVTVDRFGVGRVTYLTPTYYLAPPALGAAACYPGAAP
jgi:hypothetical protein